MLIKLGEIVLKGLNRKNFEDRLIKNIRQKILPMGNFELRNMQSTIYLIPADENVDFDELDKKIKTVLEYPGIRGQHNVKKLLGTFKRRQLNI